MTRGLRISLALAVFVLGVAPANAIGQGHAPVPGCEEIPDAEVEDLARCLYRRLGDDEAAKTSATDRLVELAERFPDSPWPYFYLGGAHWNRAEPAEAFYRKAAEAFSRTNNSAGEVSARENRARLLFRLGRLEEADQEFAAAEQVATASGDSDLAAQGRLILARNLALRGENLDKAYRLLRGDDEEACSAGLVETRRGCLLNLGNIAMDLGRAAEARRAFLRLVELASTTGDGFAQATGLYNLAQVEAERLKELPTPTRAERVRRLAGQALASARSADNPDVAAKAHWILGVLATDDRALDHLKRCQEVANSDRVRSYCLSALARVQAQTDPVAAERTVSRAGTLAEKAGDAVARARAKRDLMRVRWASDPGERALSDSWEALGTIEALRDLQPAGSVVQAGLFSSWSDDYCWLEGRILEHADSRSSREEKDRWLREAFRVGEHRRARALLDWLRRTGASTAAQQSGESVSLERVRRVLGPEEALVGFQVAPWKDVSGDFGGGSWVTVITRDRVTFHRLPGRTKVRRMVSLFEGLFDARDGSEAGPAVALHEQILAPALADLSEGIERLILVPDDALHRLPFAALRAAPEAEPLGARFELVQVPSATLWLRWREEAPEPAERPLLVLADPDLEGVDGVVTADGVQVAAVRGGGEDDAPRADAYGRLPHARREGRRAVRALRGGELLYGTEASEAAFVSSELRDYAMLHFAAHAVTDEDRPERSAILLAGGGGEDGRLSSAEIAGLDLSGRSAVLASCRSADGTVLRGEGVMSLARAFFQAGSHSVVASLWPLRDDEGEKLFERFYRHLARGETLSSALRLARRDLIRAGEPAAAWAGVVLLGDGGMIPAPREPAAGAPAARHALWIGLALPAAFALLLLGYAGVAFLRRRWAPPPQPSPVRKSAR